MDDTDNEGELRTAVRSGDQQRRIMWMPLTLILLGLWQVVAPQLLGHSNTELVSTPSGGRGPWYADDSLAELRITLMSASDVISGVLLIILGWRALRPNRPIARWAACFVGIWLVCAPIVLWAPTALSFLNASGVGVAVIALSVVLPGIPHQPGARSASQEIPPWWSFNPSAWPQRCLMAGLAFIGLVVSRYLAAYQLGYLQDVWDPFFGFSGGTRVVLDSEVSHSLPFSDAGLGAIVYTLEFLVVLMGGVARWRTTPFVVLVFGILVIPLGLTHVVLFVLMPLAVQAWCTLCFVAGLIAVPMVVLAAPEVVAMIQHLRASAGGSGRTALALHKLWFGGAAEGAQPDNRTPDLLITPEAPLRVISAGLSGVSVPFSLVVTAALGGWLYMTPAIVGIAIGSAPANIAHIAGTGVVVAATVAMAEVIRPVRLCATVAGIFAAIAIWFVGASVGYAAIVFGTGIAIALMSLPRGPRRESYAAHSDGALRSV